MSLKLPLNHDNVLADFGNPMIWAATELNSIDLGDKRLNQRAVKCELRASS
ncbi:MAG: hypothetical protein KDI44_14065 [Thiothrix sp.]|nr:hypothetical protein [Thiothrix sp.]